MATATAHQQQPAADTHTAAAAAAEAPPGPIYVDTQHEDLVHDTRMDYYGAKLATCSSGTCCYSVWLLLLLLEV